MGTLFVHAALSAIIAGVCLAVWRLREGRDWLVLVAVAYIANAGAVLVLTVGGDLSIESVLAAGTLYPLLVLQASLPAFLGVGVLRLFGGAGRLPQGLMTWAGLALVYVLVAIFGSPALGIGLGQAVTMLVFIGLAVRLARGPTFIYLLTAAVFLARGLANALGGYLGLVIKDPAMTAELFAVATVINQLCGFCLLLIEYDDTKLRLDEANRAKTAFLANMSHELRTPLNAVIGFAEVMQNQVLGALAVPYQRYVDDIATAGRNMLHLIDQLLEMAGLEAGRRKLAPRRLDIAAVVRDALAALGPDAAAQQVTVVPELPATGIDAYLDPAALAEVVHRLADRAIRFAATGTAVRAKLAVDESRITVTIADQGPAIPPARLQQLFAPFWQSDDAFVRQQDGADLGLAIAKRLTELMAGSLEAESTPGAGTTFTLRLPLGRAP